MRSAVLVTLMIVAAASEAFAQSPTPPATKPATTAAPAPTVTMSKLADHYVEGAGYVTFFHKQTKGYGGTYAECEKSCLADTRCKMIEFYKPLRKCHLYDHVKWSGKSRDADVALKKTNS